MGKLVDKKNGFIMMEILVSLFLVSVTMLTFTKAFSLSLNAYRYANNYIMALNLLENSLAKIELDRRIINIEELTTNDLGFEIRHDFAGVSDKRFLKISSKISWSEKSKVKTLAFNTLILNRGYGY